MARTATKGQPAPNAAPKPVISVPCPEDEVIRLAGFQIHARPAKGEAVWIKDGKTYPHSFAFEVATKKQVLAKAEPVPAEPSAVEAAAQDAGTGF